MSKTILSYIQVEPIFEARKQGKVSVISSLDLGITHISLELDEEGVVLPDGRKLDWQNLQKIYKHKNRCYLVVGDRVEPVVVYSKSTGWVRTLYPTHKAPTTLVSGILMHRIKDIDPSEDSLRKVNALIPPTPSKEAIVLDTATGLGYTAIEAGKRALKVITVELDPAALEIAKLNPYSKDLFDNPKITQVVGDISREVKKFHAGEFTHIIHDPPTQKLAGELYSADLYRQFRRILKQGGKLFHYIGDPKSGHGATITPGVVKRLQEAGFNKIERRPETFGLVAISY